jgi:acyl carrier protein phosphodiesterase
MAGNFAGDSYKGNLEKFEYLPEHILNGIKLHRFIDNFTDTSPIIKKVGDIFKKNGIKKVAFIASDILIDHYLTKNWSKYTDENYSDFIEILYAQTDRNLQFLEDEFCFLYNKLKKQRWLFQYDTEDGIDMVLWQFSRRIGFQNDLSSCMQIYKDNITLIDGLFADFMDEIKSQSSIFILASKF